MPAVLHSSMLRFSGGGILREALKPACKQFSPSMNRALVLRILHKESTSTCQVRSYHSNNTSTQRSSISLLRPEARARTPTSISPLLKPQHIPTTSSTPQLIHTSPFSTTTTKMSSSPSHPQNTTPLKSTDLLSLLSNRRSYYTLNSSSPISTSQIQFVLTQTLQTVPSAFNIQSTRLILAVGPHHEKIWDATARLLRQHMGEERWSTAPTASKIDSFKRAFGTVLFYEDNADVDAKKQQFKNYAHYFDGWTEHTSGMHQLAVWVALEAEGFGANLQHYNGVIDGDVAKLFEVPETWSLRAQLVFGGVEGGKRPDGKEKKATKEVLKVFE